MEDSLPPVMKAPPSDVDIANIPCHVAFIMDGNGRWAKQRGAERVKGHEAGTHSVRSVLEESRKYGIRYVTLYAFSSENWNRPKNEVHALMGLFAEYLVKERETLLAQNIRMRSIGDRSRLPQEVLDKLESLEKDTAHCEGMDLVLAVSYGGRDEIVRAAQRFTQSVLNGESSVEELNPSVFGQYLDTAEIPDPDLLIRTSGEYRISNFLLWQLAYTEIIVTETLWPDFSREEFARCLHAYAKRERRYGKTSDDNHTQATQRRHDIC